MGIAVASPEQYEMAFRKLFPRGDYWDRQFADPQSDVSLFCRAKLSEFIRFRGRMSALLQESRPHSTKELLDDWERVLRGSASPGLQTRQRLELLRQNINRGVTPTEMQHEADIFGFIITDVRLPYRPAFFGFSRFGISAIYTPAAWQVIRISVNTQDTADQVEQFEMSLKKNLLASYIPYFLYDGGNT